MLKFLELLFLELNTVWNVFLLGRGELFHTFISLAEERLSKPPSITAQNDANQVIPK